MLRPTHFQLSRSRLVAFLNDLEKAGDAARSLYLPPNHPLARVENLLRNMMDADEIPSGLSAFCAGSETGAIVFWGGPRKCLILPPFPTEEQYLTFGYDVEPLRSLLQQDFTIGLILIRLGSFAVGVCRGEALITSKVGTGFVHSRHRKGGSSQHRFERRREKQIEQFVLRVCGHVQERLGVHGRLLDYVIYGGARTTILELRKRCSFLLQFDDRTLPPLLDIPEPRQAVLEAAVGKTWSSKIVEWRED
jgi:hypothetical protein